MFVVNKCTFFHIQIQNFIFWFTYCDYRQLQQLRHDSPWDCLWVSKIDFISLTSAKKCNKKNALLFPVCIYLL